MVAAAVGLAGVAASAYSANKNSQAQSAAMGQQQNAANSQLALEQNYMNQQNALYGPLMNQYVQEASGDKPLDYGLMSSGIQGNYDTAQRNLQGMLAARGLSASGLSGAGATGLEIGRAGALSQAFQQGLDRRRQLGLNVLQHYNPGANVQGVAQAQGNLQNMYGQYAGMYGSAAQQGWGAAASGLGNAAQMWAMQGQAPQPTVNPNSPNTGGVQDPYQTLSGGQPMDPSMMQAPQLPAATPPLFGSTTPFGAGGGPGYFGDMSPSLIGGGTPSPWLGYNLGAGTTGAP